MIELKGKYCKDCVIFSDNLDDDTLSTIYNILDNPAFENQTIRIMPDVHKATDDIVIGFVSTIGDYVCPAHVGSDIGCSISTIMFNGTINPEDYPLFDHRIRENIMFGFDLQKKRIFDMKDFFKFIKKAYSSACGAWPEMIEYPDVVNEKWLSSVLKRVNMDEATFYKGICSVGSGNHFIEVGKIYDETGTTELGGMAVTIHTGSRNFGTKVFKYWDKISKRNHPNCPSGYLCDEDLKGYLSDMILCQAYAAYNHKVIQDVIVKLALKFGLKEYERIMSTHNYIDPVDRLIRKGAIRSHVFEKMIIPFNMRDGLIIAEGTSLKHWLCSANHGSGRCMSRSAAKKNIDVNDFKETMKNVFSTSVGVGTLDEAPQAYKDTDTIKEIMKDTCNVLYTVKPVINIKAKNTADE